MKVTRRTLLGGLLGAAGIAAVGCGRTPAGATTPEASASPLAGSRIGAGTPSAAALAQAVAQTPSGPTPTSTIVPPKPTVTPTPRPPTATPVVAPPPQQLEIPKIGLTAAIVGVGTKPSGELDSPTTPREVGWFVGGPRPSEPGNALLTGHLDFHTGELGVFWRLKELAPGDEILVKTERGPLRFQVENSWLYDRDTAPVDRILGFQVGRVITILTCEGKFTPYQGRVGGDYSQRRVVRARFAPTA
ncbi:MAG TPA: class F sortase [Chloroflexota bacterium]|jgi:sortase (surface protein transpeptidase)